MPDRTEVAIIIALSAGRVLVRRRPGSGTLSGLWEFPGGKRQGGESAAECAVRELEEETGLLPASAPQPLLVLDYDYPDRQLRLHFYTCRVAADPEPDGWRKVSLKELQALEMPAANRPAIARLIAGNEATSTGQGSQ